MRTNRAADEALHQLDARVPVGAPLLGGVVGLLGGLYPSARAARMEPVEALRGAQ